jgi:hypothetical protein
VDGLEAWERSSMSFDRELPRCFGVADRIFAGHPSDEDAAFEWLKSLRKRHIGWKAARAQIREYLKSKNARRAHIQEQVKRARLRLKPWLLD